MSDDPLEAAVAAAMKRDDEALDERLERLVEGRLSASELETLEAEADKDPALAKALQMARPLPASRDTAILEAVRNESNRRSPSGSRLAITDPPSAAPSHGALRERRPSGAASDRQAITDPPSAAPSGAASDRLAIGALLLAAAAAALFFLRPGESIEPLPHYVVEARTQDAAWRNENVPRRETLRADSQLSIVLRPEQPVVGPSEAMLYVIDSSGSRRSTVSAERSEDGAARWAGTGRGITGIEKGAVELIAIVGRPGAMPNVDRARADLEGPGWQAAVLRVEIRPLVVTP